MTHMFRRHAWTLIAGAALLAQNGTVFAATPDQQRPLGVLFSPIPTAPDAAAQPISSPDQRPPAEGEDARPLGVLIDRANAPRPPTAAPAPPTPTALPPSGFTAPPNRVTIDTPNATSARPLGVLLDSSAPAPQPAVPAQNLVSPAPGPAPAPVSTPVFSRPQASPERPLGTLFAPPPRAAGAQPLPAAPGPVVPAPPSASAEPPVAAVDEPPVNLAADEMTFDRERNTVTARGNVEVRYKSRTLYADEIIYDQNQDIVSARGNVTLTAPDSETIFGDEVQITGDLRDAVIENIGIILQDRARIAGAGARRSADRITEMRKATYSPCNLCEDDPTKPPMWQIKSVRVIHDKEEKIVEYRDAWLEMFGLPVFYTPYFRHPDPTVQRQSGFLFPTYGSSSDFGLILETPYFWNISPHQDATITPIIMTDEFPVLALEYRNRLLTGEIDVAASVTDNQDDEFNTTDGDLGVRGHIDARGRFEIDRTWRWGFDIDRSTDDTYLRRYGFTSPQSLNSQIFAEAFRSRSYFSVSTHTFQGLEESDSANTTPIVLPLMDFSHVGKRDRTGGRTYLDVNMLAMTRSEGTDTRRLSFHPRWERPFITRFGDAFNIATGLNADFYHVNSLERSGDEGQFTGFSYRAVPYLKLDWRRPMIRRSEATSQTIEPIASVVLRPYGGNSEKIPNEDSVELEFDETNLFSDNRFTGIDRLEGGPRVNYGLNWGITGDEGRQASIFFGQSYRIKADSTFASGTGLEENFSDLVGKVEISASSLFNVLYRTRVATDNLEPRRNEAQFTAGTSAFNLSGSYVFLQQQEDSEFAGREELNLTASSQLNREWRMSVSGVRDLEDSEMRSLGMQLTYENECVIFRTSITRTFFEDRDIKPTDAISFFLTLKTIGEVKTGFSRDGS